MSFTFAPGFTLAGRSVKTPLMPWTHYIIPFNAAKPQWPADVITRAGYRLEYAVFIDKSYLGIGQIDLA
jgi:hypothetical protein